MNPILQRMMRSVVRRGSLTVIDRAGQAFTFGDGTGQPHVMRFHDRTAERLIVAHPELAFGETYIVAHWSLERGTLATLLQLLIGQPLHAATSSLHRVVRTALRRYAQRNTARAARRNASRHYDVGNEVYRLFLDEDWQYSCAYFADPSSTLEDAQRAKKRHIAAKLLLQPGHRVLDIGCGWGGALPRAPDRGRDHRSDACRQSGRPGARPRGRRSEHRVPRPGLPRCRGRGSSASFRSACSSTWGSATSMSTSPPAADS